MPLFNDKTLQNALAALAWEPTSEQLASARAWADRASDPGFDLQNESQLDPTWTVPAERRANAVG